MYHLPIEREIHLLLLKQFLERAAAKNVSQRSLANRIGITEIHLSRLKRGHKDWRPLTPEMARSIMEELNYRASQIAGVENMLKFFRESRTKRRHVAETYGLANIEMESRIIDNNKNPAIVMSLQTKHGGPVGVVIRCHEKCVEFYDADNCKITVSQAASQLMPRKRDASVLLAKVYIALRDECWKSVAADLDYFDSEEGMLKGKSRLLRLENALGTAVVTEQAAKIFDDFCTTLIEQATG